MAALRPGQMLEGTSYQVVREVGAGGMGLVYEVEHVRLKKRYVAKTIHDLIENEVSAQRRMEREAQVLASIEHPNIVQVHDFGTTSDGVTYFVMDKLQGLDLRRMMKTQPMARMRAVEIMIDVLDALDHVHRLGIVHRDIKPDNIFLAEIAGTGGSRTVTKVLDFGIAHLFGASSLESKDRLTKTGGFVGTLYYAAPEQMQGKPASPSNDVYGVGLVLFELIAKRGPFDDDAGVGLLRCFNPAPRLAEFAKAPIELSDVVARALETDPARRPSASALANELRGVLTRWRQTPGAAESDAEEADLDDLLAGIARRHALEAKRPAAGRRPDAPNTPMHAPAHAEPPAPAPAATAAPATPLMHPGDRAAAAAAELSATMASPGMAEAAPAARVGSSPGGVRVESVPQAPPYVTPPRPTPLRGDSIPHAPPHATPMRGDSIPHAPPHATPMRGDSIPHATPMRGSVPQAAPMHYPSTPQARPFGNESVPHAAPVRFESVPQAPARSIPGPYGSVDGVQLSSMAASSPRWGIIAVAISSLVALGLVLSAIVYRSYANRGGNENANANAPSSMPAAVSIATTVATTVTAPSAPPPAAVSSSPATPASATAAVTVAERKDATPPAPNGGAAGANRGGAGHATQPVAPPPKPPAQPTPVVPSATTSAKPEHKDDYMRTL